MIENNYHFSISGKAKENMETVKRSSNNVIEFLQSEGYIRFKADSEASSKALYEAYQRWCEDNAQKPMSANRLSSELAQNERLYNVEATNNVHVGGKRVRGFMGIEVVNPLPYKNENRTSKLPYTPFTLYGIFQLHPQNTVLLVPLVKQFTASCKICR